LPLILVRTCEPLDRISKAVFRSTHLYKNAEEQVECGRFAATVAVALFVFDAAGDLC